MAQQSEELDQNHSLFDLADSCSHPWELWRDDLPLLYYAQRLVQALESDEELEEVNEAVGSAGITFCQGDGPLGHLEITLANLRLLVLKAQTGPLIAVDLRASEILNRLKSCLNGKKLGIWAFCEFKDCQMPRPLILGEVIELTVTRADLEIRVHQSQDSSLSIEMNLTILAWSPSSVVLQKRHPELHWLSLTDYFNPVLPSRFEEVIYNQELHQLETEAEELIQDQQKNRDQNRTHFEQQEFFNKIYYPRVRMIQPSISKQEPRRREEESSWDQLNDRIKNQRAMMRSSLHIPKGEVYLFQFQALILSQIPYWRALTMSALHTLQRKLGGYHRYQQPLGILEDDFKAERGVSDLDELREKNRYADFLSKTSQDDDIIKNLEGSQSGDSPRNLDREQTSELIVQSKPLAREVVRLLLSSGKCKVPTLLKENPIVDPNQSTAAFIKTDTQRFYTLVEELNQSQNNIKKEEQKEQNSMKASQISVMDQTMNGVMRSEHGLLTQISRKLPTPQQNSESSIPGLISQEVRPLTASFSKEQEEKALEQASSQSHPHQEPCQREEAEANFAEQSMDEDTLQRLLQSQTSQAPEFPPDQPGTQTKRVHEAALMLELMKLKSSSGNDDHTEPKPVREILLPSQSQSQRLLVLESSQGSNVEMLSASLASRKEDKLKLDSSADSIGNHQQNSPLRHSQPLDDHAKPAQQVVSSPAEQAENDESEDESSSLQNLNQNLIRFHGSKIPLNMNGLRLAQDRLQPSQFLEIPKEKPRISPRFYKNSSQTSKSDQEILIDGPSQRNDIYGSISQTGDVKVSVSQNQISMPSEKLQLGGNHPQSQNIVVREEEDFSKKERIRQKWLDERINKERPISIYSRSGFQPPEQALNSGGAGEDHSQASMQKGDPSQNASLPDLFHSQRGSFIKEIADFDLLMGPPPKRFPAREGVRPSDLKDLEAQIEQKQVQDSPSIEWPRNSVKPKPEHSSQASHLVPKQQAPEPARKADAQHSDPKARTSITAGQLLDASLQDYDRQSAAVNLQTTPKLNNVLACLDREEDSALESNEPSSALQESSFKLDSRYFKAASTSAPVISPGSDTSRSELPSNDERSHSETKVNSSEEERKQFTKKQKKRFGVNTCDRSRLSQIDPIEEVEEYDSHCILKNDGYIDMSCASKNSDKQSDQQDDSEEAQSLLAKFLESKEQFESVLEQGVFKQVMNQFYDDNNVFKTSKAEDLYKLIHVLFNGIEKQRK